mgnify:CR=1 FL=1|tara:strand:+ start:527 stop:838 length:312 start_codon:yes stop_codon:yes gene_type:complete
MIEISDYSLLLEKIKQRDKLFILDFYANWCGPCKILSPRLSKIEKAYNDVVFYKINVDKAPEIVELYNIRCMPTVLYIKNRDEFARIEGLNIKNITKLIELYK